MEREIKKLENRFFGVLKSEKDDLQQIHEREIRIVQVRGSIERKGLTG